ncbi:hypothetical protein EUA93_05870 [Nocardioides oleivorans]|uniref:WXG100 family type VII secretion target n=1 Tax=Nocardioides oleivorans TaxID=273676 RepID=A0A4Q2S0N5_9ACTN|nr:hypothetical protein [Nocardioides oleivorans]RYB93925.1 hypothetical protein EUA93_05870 [Nocardioides oleivorans]
MGLLDDAVSGLRGVLATVEDIDLWPPWDAAQTIVDAVAQAVEIATQPPEPKPGDLNAAAAVWRRIATSVDDASNDLGTCRDKIGTAAWDGTSGDGFRTSMARLRTRTDTVPPACRAVATALDTLADSMTDARERHRRADDQLRQNLELSWGDLLPWELVDHLRGVVEGVVHAIREAIGAYEDAADAIHVARNAIRTAMDEIDLPDHLPDGISPVSLVNGWEDEDGPLSGSALEDYDEAFGNLSPAEQQAVRDALAGARSDEERAWIIAGVASGLSGTALANYLTKLHTMSPSELDDLDPPTDGSYEQPDQTTCGSSTLVMSRMLNDPAYALWIETGYDPETGITDPRTPEQRFADESLAMHDRTNSHRDRDGDLQFPWPEAAGTQPWAVANEMSSDGGSGVPGTDYEVDTVAPGDRGTTYDHIATAVESGHNVPLYVGDTTRPGHVVLVTGSTGDTLTIFDPASGHEQTISRDDFTSGNLGVSGWDEPWFAVTPSS